MADTRAPRPEVAAAASGGDASSVYGMGVTLHAPFADVVGWTRALLAEQGFGILTEIDLAATLKKKLDVDVAPQVILGACNPPMAHRALSVERNIGLLLPCNVVVYATEDAGRSIVSAVDPEVSLGRVGNEELAPVAADVKARLRRVLDAVAA